MITKKPLKGFNDCRYPEDIKRLFSIAISAGYLLSCCELENIWEEYSNEQCAQWLILKSYCDSDLLAILEGAYND